MPIAAYPFVSDRNAAKLDHNPISPVPRDPVTTIVKRTGKKLRAVIFDGGLDNHTHCIRQNTDSEDLQLLFLFIFLLLLLLLLLLLFLSLLLLLFLLSKIIKTVFVASRCEDGKC